jgi:acyl dehydratase
MEKGLITDQALEVFRSRVGNKLRINNIFNELASKDAIRKFVDGIGDPNPLWRDEEYARTTRHGRLVAPPSWLNSVFPTWVLQGLPGVHAFHTSTDWEFYRPVYVDDKIRPESVFTGFSIRSSDFAGRSVIERQEARYYNQRRELVARAKVAGLRAERGAARENGKYSQLQLPHPWTDQELASIEDQILGEEIRGPHPRYWEDVEVGEQLLPLTRGPLGLTDVIAYCIGAAPVQIQAQGMALRQYRKHPAWAFRDPNTCALEPVYGVHYNEAAAEASGLPYPYDTAVQRHCWLLQFLTNWMGDGGWVKRSNARYRNFVYLSDVVWIHGKVTKKYIDDQGACCVDIKTSAINQRGEEVMPGTSTVLLPSREKGTHPISTR